MQKAIQINEVDQVRFNTWFRNACRALINNPDPAPLPPAPIESLRGHGIELTYKFLDKEKILQFTLLHWPPYEESSKIEDVIVSWMPGPVEGKSEAKKIESPTKVTNTAAKSATIGQQPDDLQPVTPEEVKAAASDPQMTAQTKPSGTSTDAKPVLTPEVTPGSVAPDAQTQNRL